MVIVHVAIVVVIHAVVVIVIIVPIHVGVVLVLLPIDDNFVPLRAAVRVLVDADFTLAIAVAVANGGPLARRRSGRDRRLFDDDLARRGCGGGLFLDDHRVRLDDRFTRRGTDLALRPDDLILSHRFAGDGFPAFVTLTA